MKRGNKRKFGRVRKQRMAFLKSLATALIERGRITTTETRAKVLRGVVEKQITLAKKQTLAARRMLLRVLGEEAVRKLMTELGPRFQERHGGYTRIFRLEPRRSDGAHRSLIEFVQ